MSAPESPVRMLGAPGRGTPVVPRRHPGALVLAEKLITRSLHQLPVAAWPDTQAANVWCSALSSVCSAALAALRAALSPWFGAAVACSDASSLASAALQALTAAAWAPSSFSCPSVDATALTHAPCTPFGPCGHVVRAAKATASPCASLSVPLAPSCIAKADAVPSVRAAAAPRMAIRNLCIGPSCVADYDPFPSLESNNAEARASNQTREPAGNRRPPR